MLRFLRRRGADRKVAQNEASVTLRERRALFAKSGLFDRDWYLTQNPDIRRSGRDPLDHLAEHGARECRNPGPGFDTAYYVEANPSCKDTGMSPLEHFLCIGRHTGASPTRPVVVAEVSLSNLIAQSGLFDAAWYLVHYPDVEISGEDPFAHFIRTGLSERRDPGPNFEAVFYASRTPSLSSSGMSALEHFLRLGKEAGASPSGKAWREGQHFELLLKESGLFDAQWYLDRYADVAAAGLDPFQHLVVSGANEWRDPGPNFEAAFYAERCHAFPADRSISPLEHYLRFGRAAGIVAKGPPVYERWLAQFDDLTADDRARIKLSTQTTTLPAVTCLLVASHDEDGEPGDQLSIAEQIGVRPTLQLVGQDINLISRAEALAACPDGSVVILIAAGTRLRPQAAYTFALALSDSEADAAYSDHDHHDPAGARVRPVFKPAMSPDFMAQFPYAGPVVAVRIAVGTRPVVAATLDRVVAADPATIFASLLLALDWRRVRRIPLCLYSLPYMEHAVQTLGREVFEPIPGVRETGPSPVLDDPPEVRILIPTRDRRELLEPCIASLLGLTRYPRERMRIVVIDNDTRDPDSLTYLATLAQDPQCTVVRSPGQFNFSKICNDGAAATDGDVLVFLNNDITVIDPDWLLAMVAHAVRPEIGAVGAKLLYPDDTVQHGGVVLGIQGVGAHRLARLPVEVALHFDATREMTAVTGACLALRREVFASIGGFDPALAVAFNDVVLCARLFERGYRNLYIARPLFHHHESKSRGLDDSPEKQATNRREAIYARSRHGALFRDDPSYTPNLSLQKIGDLAVPPRVVPPWRRSATGRRVILLSSGHGLGHGIGCVVAVQAAHFLRCGWSVTVGGPVSSRDQVYPGCTRVELVTETQAAAFAVTGGYDCIIAHTPPFFSVSRYLGHRPLFYVYDHGEPLPHLFEDRVARESVDWEKRFCAPLAQRVFAISQTIFDEQYRGDTVVLRNGNTHLAQWSPEWASKRQALRRKFGVEGRFVILNVCRFHKMERRYKGTDQYSQLAAEAPYMVPALAQRAVFAIAGRGDDEDVDVLRKAGLRVFPNVTDLEMAELYAASDLYVSLSEWEGYNLGIGQALAMGLEVVASDIPAHREFGIPTAAAIPKLCALVSAAFSRWDEAALGRTAHLQPWDTPLSQLMNILEEDVAADAAQHWL